MSAGHSDASAAEATAPRSTPASRYVTHLFNAMAPLHHREPGLAGVALTDERVRVGVIADGLHVAPGGGGAGRPGGWATGSRWSPTRSPPWARPPGRCAWVPVEAPAAGGGVRLADGTLAGSVLPLDRAVRNLVAFAGVPLEAAIAAATAAPARVLGCADRGVLAPGAVGDLVLLDGGGAVAATVVSGRVAWEAPWRS